MDILIQEYNRRMIKIASDYTPPHSPLSALSPPPSQPPSQPPHLPVPPPPPTPPSPPGAPGKRRDDSFAVIVDPLLSGVEIKKWPIGFLSDVDCFHPSRVAHETIARGV
ncbi:hypothetical protein HK102_011739, partial [Quaeritorhiza haematococci]